MKIVGGCQVDFEPGKFVVTFPFKYVAESPPPEDQCVLLAVAYAAKIIGWEKVLNLMMSPDDPFR